MGNVVCCNKRKLENMENLMKNKLKTKSKSDLVLKIDKLKKKRNGNIVFCFLMGTSSIITILVICHGGAEPTVIGSLVVSSGACLFYFNEITKNNNLIEFYEKELRKRQ